MHSAVAERSSNAARSSMAQQVNNDALAQSYKHCISLEQKLRDELKQQNFYHADVRKVRAKLRLAYEGLLFSDHAGAQVRSVARS